MERGQREQRQRVLEQFPAQCPLRYGPEHWHVLDAAASAPAAGSRAVLGRGPDAPEKPSTEDEWGELFGGGVGETVMKAMKRAAAIHRKPAKKVTKKPSAMKGK